MTSVLLRARDLVLLIDVIQEMPDWDKLLGDVLQVLRHVGVLAVFPMHVDAKGVIDAAASGFRYEGMAVEGRFLLFTKANPSH